MDIKLLKVQGMLEWVKTKLHLDVIAPNASNRVIKRGQVYKCNFGLGVGSEMQKERPCVILQNNIGNLKSSNTIVAPITHNKSKIPCMAAITTINDENGNVVLDGQVNTSNLICVSKARLGDYICDISTSDMKKVDEALAKTTGLMSYYSAVEKKLQNKLTYIEKIKQDRNSAQDFIKDIQHQLGVDNQEEIREKLKKILENVDS